VFSDGELRCYDIDPPTTLECYPWRHQNDFLRLSREEKNILPTDKNLQICVYNTSGLRVIYYIGPRGHVLFVAPATSKC